MSGCMPDVEVAQAEVHNSTFFWVIVLEQRDSNFKFSNMTNKQDQRLQETKDTKASLTEDHIGVMEDHTTPSCHLRGFMMMFYHLSSALLQA